MVSGLCKENVDDPEVIIQFTLLANHDCTVGKVFFFFFLIKKIFFLKVNLLGFWGKAIITL